MFYPAPGLIQKGCMGSDILPFDETLLSPLKNVIGLGSLFRQGLVLNKKRENRTLWIFESLHYCAFLSVKEVKTNLMRSSESVTALAGTCLVHDSLAT